jgi:hypothetical protein
MLEEAGDKKRGWKCGLGVLESKLKIKQMNGEKERENEEEKEHKSIRATTHIRIRSSSSC